MKNAVGIHMEQSNDIVIRGIVHFNKAADTDLRGRHGGAVLRRSSAILHAPHNTIFSGICATGGLAALGAILLPLMRSLSIVIADVLLSIAGSLAFWALSILLWYNIALWSSDIYTVACMPLDIIVLAMILISTAMSRLGWPVCMLATVPRPRPKGFSSIPPPPPLAAAGTHGSASFSSSSRPPASLLCGCLPFLFFARDSAWRSMQLSIRARLAMHCLGAIRPGEANRA